MRLYRGEVARVYLPAMLVVTGAVIAAAQETAAVSGDRPLVLEVADQRTKPQMVPVFEPPRHRYVVLYAPPASDIPATIREPRLKGVAVRAARVDAAIVVELLLVLRGVPDLEQTLAVYRLAPGDSVRTEPLLAYGLAPLTLRAHAIAAVTSPPPAVELPGRMLRATVATVPGAIPLYRLSLTNASEHKGVYGLALDLRFEDGTRVTKMPSGVRGQALAGPGGTTVQGMNGNASFQNGAFTPVAARVLRIVAVVFDDGTFEGHPGAADELLARRGAELWQVRRELALLEPLDSPSGAPGDDALAGAYDALQHLSWGTSEVSELTARCEACARVRPSLLRAAVEACIDLVLQDIERLRATAASERSGEWRRMLAGYRHWRGD